jgi:hypothetical protein
VTNQNRERQTLMSKVTCSGDGYCLYQTNDGYDENTKHSDILCNFQCKPIKCPNFIVCGANYPKWATSREGTCLNCGISFHGKLVIEQKMQECCICFEEMGFHVKRLNCEHQVCAKCFKRCAWGDESREGEPEFPYPDKEEAFLNDEIDQDTWNKFIHGDDPLMIQYNKAWSDWDNKREQKQIDEEESLGKCAICRK